MSRKENSTILVTGAAGFIGSHIVDRLLSDTQNKIVAVDNLSLGRKENLAEALNNKRTHFHQIDCTNSDQLKSLFSTYDSFEWIIHCAVEPLEQSLEDPIGSFQRNIQMTENICELMRIKKAEKLLNFSSSEVYGSLHEGIMDETHPILPHTPYAASKAAADLLVYSYYKTFGIQTVTLRPFNNYGPRQNTEKYAGVVPLTLKRLSSNISPTLSGDGLQKRDFIYVKDTARAVLQMMNKAILDGQVYNVASGEETSIKNLVYSLIESWGKTIDIKHTEIRPGDVQRHKGSISKFKNFIDPSFSLTSMKIGIEETVLWYKNSLSKK